MAVVGKLNSVANTEGKGRDDLTLDILVTAEGLHRRLSHDSNRAVRALAGQIRNAFGQLRELFRKYDQNIEVVDPQLKNNAELVKALSDYEASWEKGKMFFLNAVRCNQLIFFSSEV